jgi:hypothetical protein
VHRPHQGLCLLRALRGSEDQGGEVGEPR